MLRRLTTIGLACLAILLGAGTGIASAQATTQTFVSRTELNELRLFVCLDEAVRLTGGWQNVNHVTEDAAGGFTFVSNSNFVQLRGVGVESGQRYQSVGTSQGNTTGHIRGDFPATFNTETTAHLIAQGQPNPGVEFTFRYRAHYTINANGEVVLDRAEVIEECR